MGVKNRQDAVGRPHTSLVSRLRCTWFAGWDGIPQGGPPNTPAIGALCCRTMPTPRRQLVPKVPRGTRRRSHKSEKQRVCLFFALFFCDHAALLALVGALGSP